MGPAAQTQPFAAQPRVGGRTRSCEAGSEGSATGETTAKSAEARGLKRQDLSNIQYVTDSHDAGRGFESLSVELQRAFTVCDGADALEPINLVDAVTGSWE